MLDFIDRMVRSFFTGCFVILIAGYLLVEKGISVAFYEKSVPVSAIAIEKLEWSDRDYGLDDRQIAIEAEFRNNSDMKLINLELQYDLFDCPTTSTARAGCRPVHSSAENAAVDTPARFRGRFTNSFIVPRMAKPQGVLVLDAKLMDATGVPDQSDRN